MFAVSPSPFLDLAQFVAGADRFKSFGETGSAMKRAP